MIDVFIEKYRWYIGGALILVIAIGVSVIFWDRTGKNKANSQNQQIAELQAQNESLRQELSANSSKSVAGVTTSENESDKININTADATELDKLPNIGPARAADIISYRESHGGFKTIEEIKNIKGIGDKSFEELKDLITVGDLST